MRKILIIDIETSENFSFIGLYEPEEQVVLQEKIVQVPYTVQNVEKILASFPKYEMILFYNVSFDLTHLLLGRLDYHPHTISNIIIECRCELMKYVKKNDPSREFIQYAAFCTEKLPLLYVDVLPLVKIHATQENGNILPHKNSLKYYSALYLGRIIEERKSLFTAQALRPDQIEFLYKYNQDDLKATYDIFMKIQPVFKAQVELSKLMGMNCCTKTNSGLIIPFLKYFLKKDKLPEIIPLTGQDIFDPRFLEEPLLKKYVEIYKKIGDKNFNKSSIKTTLFPHMHVVLGTGGLHAIAEEILYPADLSDYVFVDFDIVSQYPSIYTQLDGVFHKDIRDVLQKLMEQRKELKRTGGNEALIAGIKILLNGCYGKLGMEENDQCGNYTGMLRVATAGQLQILFTVIKLNYEHNVKVVYLNTDGFTILLKKDEVWRIPEITEVVRGLVNRFFSNMDIEVNVYTKCCFFNVNSYCMVTEDGKIKVKKDFKETICRSIPPYIPKQLKTRLLGIPSTIQLDDYVFIKTSKNGFVDEDRKIVLCYYSKTKSEVEMNGHYVQFIQSKDHIQERDIDKDAYEFEIKQLLEQERVEHYTEQEKEIMKNDTEVYIPVRKNGKYYVSMPCALYFPCIQQHNEFIILNRPSNNCLYKQL
ncbi:MAG: hypothetical protein ACRCY4_09530 [Brevinema sp.]